MYVSPFLNLKELIGIHTARTHLISIHLLVVSVRHSTLSTLKYSKFPSFLLRENKSVLRQPIIPQEQLDNHSWR
ncbi:hypothetical protein AQUCO_01700015v1 [Aquilegia coerulea]|uniref:Uncharacterized protein n=1 Tax=Aquilegia coerulea TaxID=218851 RepID=A0A2G5DKS0_AQUCA|nr:hypothetical protein AQUCO_01700015v1 [Aquilegia coerulea]